MLEASQLANITKNETFGWFSNTVPSKSWLVPLVWLSATTASGLENFGRNDWLAVDKTLKQCLGCPLLRKNSLGVQGNLNSLSPHTVE